MLQKEVQIVGSCRVDDFPSFPGADDEAAAGKACKVGRQGVLPHFQPRCEFSSGQSRGRGDEFLQRAQARDMAEGRQTLRKIDFIHASRLVDMRDKRVTPH